MGGGRKKIGDGGGYIWKERKRGKWMGNAIVL